MNSAGTPNTPQRTAILTACLVGLIGLTACQTTPTGNTGGRIDPYRSTDADRASRSASMPAMLEFSDQVAQQLIQDLARIDQVQQIQGKAVLELGDLNNQTQTPTGDFELIQRRIRGQLFASDLLHQQFIVVEPRQRMDLERERVAGDQTTSARYPAEQTFVLSGDFFEARRSSVRRYYFTFKLVNLATRQIVFLKDYDLAQQ